MTGTTDVTQGVVNYLDPHFVANLVTTPEFYSEDTSRSTIVLRSATVPIQNARPIRNSLSFDDQGFMLVDHKSAVTDFENSDEVQRLYAAELERLILDLSGAAVVRVTPGFLLRFGEGSKKTGSRTNSRPGRFAHSDYSEVSAQKFAKARAPDGLELRPGQRFAAFNIWRAVSHPPQDIPLAVCDPRSVSPTDCVTAYSVIDAPGAPEFRFESTLFVHNPAHRWHYFRDMTRHEVLIFKAYDSDQSRPQCVPHSAFDDPGCPRGVPTRVSIEARAFAYF